MFFNESIFNDTEEISAKLNVTRNRYINEAVDWYNQVNKRRLLQTQLEKESRLTSNDSMDILQEFEQISLKY